MLNKDLKKEVIRMCVGVSALSLIMVLAFAVCGMFDLPVLFGALLGTGIVLLNYFLLALSLQYAAEKETKEAKNLIKFSYTSRLIFIAASIIVAIKLPYFNYITAILPLFFERIVIMIFHLKEKRS